MPGHAEIHGGSARVQSLHDVREGGVWTWRQRLKNELIYGAIRALIGLAVFLPRRVTRSVCRGLGLLFFLLLRRQRAVVEERLRLGLGDEPGVLAREVFVTIAGFVADTIELLRPDERARSKLSLDEPSRRVFAEALEEGTGVVFVAAHLGPWERMAALLVEEGFSVTTVARESYDPRLTEFYERLRRPRGVRSFYRGRPGALLAMARELKAGRAVGFLMDLPTRVPSIEAQLFGDRALLPLGPARLAIARRSAVLVGTCAPPPTSATSAKGAVAHPIVRITRIETRDLGHGVGAEVELVNRITDELSRRIVAWPQGWLGMFVPPRLRLGMNSR